MDDYNKKYQEWLNNPNFDEETKEELKSIEGNEEEIKDRFYKELEFGTAGLRGIIGAGTNRMNKYTVGKATQGLANYIKAQNGEEKGVVISYDSRHKSDEFSELAALILNANGIKTYRFESLRTVPELSFSVRELNCIAGIMITASHNPPEYNGYKVYWDDGAQIVPPTDKEIINEVNAITDFSTIKQADKAEAEAKGLYNTVGEEVDKKFIEKLESLVINPEAIKQNQKDVKIVYTPLHGTGRMPVERILADLGFENVYIVSEQKEPDGDFPTVEYPNPEDPRAFKMALDLAKKKDADIVLANDPDADRIGLYVKDNEGNYVPFTGNMTAMLILEYELSQKKEKGKLPMDSAVISTIVSTNMVYPIAENYGSKVFETLTGFKWIGEKIRQWEKEDTYRFMFGFEESYGCIIASHARDKDGISAVMALCEMAAFYKGQGISLYEQMQNLYKKYGYYKEKQISIVLKGADGAQEISNKMEKIRNNPPKELAGMKVNEYRDYQNHIVLNKDSSQTMTDLPTSNVLYFDLEDGAWACVRPSGTEPKIKFYMGVKGKDDTDAISKLEKLANAMNNLME